MAQTNTNKKVMITGGSSGIGLALAEEYARQGCDLFLIAQDSEKLNATGSKLSKSFPEIRIMTFTCNVASESEVQALAEKISSHTDSLDLLICNAGRLRCGRFESHRPGDSSATFNVNYWGAHNTTYYFLPLLRSGRKPCIAFVSSVAGYTGLFGYAHYAPSKFAIAGLAECLRMEFKDYNIKVSVIYPPDTETPMLQYERQNTLPECKALSKGASTITVEKAARTIVAGIEKGKFEIYFNFESRFIRILKGPWPSLYYSIVDGIVRSAKKKEKSHAV